VRTKLIIAGLALVGTIGVSAAGYIAVDRIGVLATADSHAGVIVSCKSQVRVRRSSKRLTSHRSWSYAPIVVTRSGHKAVGTLFFPKKSTCTALIGNSVPVFVNKVDPSKNRINSFTQFWLFPTVILFVILFIGGLLFKPALSLLAFFSFFAISTLAVAFELNWLGDSNKNAEFSASERSHLALTQCVSNEMERLGIHRKSDLKKLNCRNLGLVDVSPLSDFSGLEELYLQSNNLTSLAPHWRMKKLRKLSIMLNKKMASLKGIEQLTALEELRAHGMKISSIEPLRELKALRILSMSRNQVDDISALQNLSALEQVDMNFNPVSDLSALANKPNLKRVNFYGSKVKDISPLFDNQNLKIVGVTNKAGIDCFQFNEMEKRLPTAAKVYRPKSCR